MDETQLVSTLLSLLKSAGAPTAAMAAGIWAAFRVGKWVSSGCSRIGEKVVTPLVDRAVNFINDVNETQKAHAQTLRDVSASLESIHDTQKEQGRILEKIHAAKVTACRYPGGNTS